jgi:hypothetical protein
MNAKRMVKISNIIGLAAVLALIYWVIIFITIQVFGLRIFKEHLSDTFNYSIIAILVLMFGALIINIMFNLSRIAEKFNNEENITKSRNGIILFISSIPLIICMLFLGNYISGKQMENNLKNSADEIINSYVLEINKICDYSLTKDWINNVVNMTELMVRIDPNFNNVAIIVEDEINGNNFYLTFSQRDGISKSENTEINKIRYVRNYELKEREYLDKIFKNNYNEKYFLSVDGSYNLFIPFENNGKKIVFLFSNRQRYGTLSS